VTGKEINFTLDFSQEQHQLLTSSPLKVSSFATKQAHLLKGGQRLAKQLIPV
jgi:hypothetical protein